jgi:hypothetical protein
MTEKEAQRIAMHFHEVMSEKIEAPKVGGGEEEGRRAEDEATLRDNSRPRSMGERDSEAVKLFWQRYHEGLYDPNSENVYEPAKKEGAIPTGPMFGHQDAADVVGRHDERTPIKRESTIDAFSRRYKREAGVSAGFCHDQEVDAQRDSRRGAGSGSEPPYWTDGMPGMTAAGRAEADDEQVDGGTDEKVRGHKANVARKAQYKDDLASFNKYFDQESDEYDGEDAEDAEESNMKAQAKCPKCGEKQRLPHKLVRKEGKGQSRLAAVKCVNKRCGESMAVAPPKGYAFGRPISEAQATFAWRYRRETNGGPVLPWN